MNRFAALIDALSFEPGRNAKLSLLTNYFRSTLDPERGYALAALTGALVFANAKPAMIRGLIQQRVDPVLFALSYDYVGDLSETVALLWGDAQDIHTRPQLNLTEVVTALSAGGKLNLAKKLGDWLDQLDETGRWALLKLITGGNRIGVSARLAKTAVAMLGGLKTDEVEHVWHGLAPPYLDLFAWVDGNGPKPQSLDPAPFRPVMLAHALEAGDISNLNPADFAAEWKWDGIRVQLVSGIDGEGHRITRLYSRTGEDISAAFPDLTENTGMEAAVDGELLVKRDGQIQSFNMLQQRLNRKTINAQLLEHYPAHIRAYDLLQDGPDDIRHLPFTQRRERLVRLLVRHGDARLDISPLVPFGSFEALMELRKSPNDADAPAIEGCMLKRLDSPYLPGRPRGLWFKWKRDPMVADCVLMYAQRGHGKRSSFYSDFTFGAWRTGETGADELVPVGKAYFGFTDEELVELDRFVRRSEGQRFGPVREVKLARGPDGRPAGLVLEIAFEGLQRSTRHKSGIAMRFPRISRIRWDKPADEADRLETLEALLAAPPSGL